MRSTSRSVSSPTWTVSCIAADVNAACTMRTSAFPLACWISHPACSNLWDSKAINLCLLCLLERNSSFLVWSAMLEVKCTVTPIVPPDLLIWAQSLVLGLSLYPSNTIIVLPYYLMTYVLYCSKIWSCVAPLVQGIRCKRAPPYKTYWTVSDGPGNWILWLVELHWLTQTELGIVTEFVIEDIL